MTQRRPDRLADVSVRAQPEEQLLVVGETRLIESKGYLHAFDDRSQGWRLQVALDAAPVAPVELTFDTDPGARIVRWRSR